MSAYIIYDGGGSFLPNVPARDLTEEEAKIFGVDYLLKSGLYKRAVEETKKEEEVIIKSENRKITKKGDV